MKVNLTLDVEAQGMLVKCMASMPLKDEDGNIRGITPQLVFLTALKEMAKGVKWTVDAGRLKARR